MCINQNKYFVFDLETVTSKEVLNFEETASTKTTDSQKTTTETIPVKKTEQKVCYQSLLSLFSLDLQLC